MKTKYEQMKYDVTIYMVRQTCMLSHIVMCHPESKDGLCRTWDKEKNAILRNHSKYFTFLFAIFDGFLMYCKVIFFEILYLEEHYYGVRHSHSLC